MAELKEIKEHEEIDGEDETMRVFLSTFSGGHIPDSSEDLTAHDESVPSSLMNIIRKALESVDPEQILEKDVQPGESPVDWPTGESVEGYNYDEIKQRIFGSEAESVKTVRSVPASFLGEASHDSILEEDELSESTPHTDRRLPSPYEDPLEDFLERYPVGLQGIFRALVKQLDQGDTFSEYLGEGFHDAQEPIIDIAQAIRDLSDSDSVSCEQVESSSGFPVEQFVPCPSKDSNDKKEESSDLKAASQPCIEEPKPLKECLEETHPVTNQLKYYGNNIPDPPLDMKWFKAMIALVPKCWNIDKAIRNSITVVLEYIAELDPSLRPKDEFTNAMYAFSLLDFLKHEQCIDRMLNVYYGRYKTSVLRDKLFDKVFMYALLFKLTARNFKKSTKFFNEFPLDQIFPLLNFMNKHKNRVAMLMQASLLYSFDYINERFSLDQDFMKEFFGVLFKEMERQKMKKASILFNHNWIYNRGEFKHFTAQKPKTPLERTLKIKPWKAKPLPKYHKKCLRPVKKGSTLYSTLDNQDTLNDVSSIKEESSTQESEKPFDYGIVRDSTDESIVGEGEYEEEIIDEEKLKENKEILRKYGIVKKLKKKPRSSHLIGFDAYFTQSYKKKQKKSLPKKKDKIKEKKKSESEDEDEELGEFQNQNEFIAKFMLKRRVDEKEAEKKRKKESIENRLRELRAKNKLPPVVQTNATILRDAKILEKEKEEQIQRIEELVSASRSFLDYEGILEKYRQMREQEEILEIERKHLEGLLSREEAIIAKQNLIIENAKKKKQADEEKKILEEKLEELRREELQNAQMIVEETREILFKIKDKQQDILQEKRRLAQERARQKEMNSKRIFQKKKNELEKKIELVRQIKAFQLIQKEHQELHKQKLNILCNLSSDELKAQIEKCKQIMRKDLQERQNIVLDKKMERKALLDAAKGFVKEMRKCKKNIRREQVPQKPDKNQVVESDKKILDLKTKFDQARVQRIKNLEMLRNPKKSEAGGSVARKTLDSPSNSKKSESIMLAKKNSKLQSFAKKIQSSISTARKASKDEGFAHVGTSTSFSDY